MRFAAACATRGRRTPLRAGRPQFLRIERGDGAASAGSSVVDTRSGVHAIALERGEELLPCAVSARRGIQARVGRRFSACRYCAQRARRAFRLLRSLGQRAAESAAGADDEREGFRFGLHAGIPAPWRLRAYRLRGIVEIMKFTLCRNADARRVRRRFDQRACGPSWSASARCACC